MSARLQVIEEAIEVEELMSRTICAVLNVDFNNSTLFGVKSGSLPFHVKIGILQEVQYFDSLTRDKLSLFSQIRNRFAHSSEAVDFTSCFNSLQQCVSKLNKWYPKNDDILFDTEERRYYGLYYNLFVEVMNEVGKFRIFITDKVNEEEFLMSTQRWTDTFMHQIDMAQLNDPEFTDKMQKIEIDTNEIVDAMPPIERSPLVKHLFTHKTLP